MQSKTSRLGDYIEQSYLRNRDKSITHLRGLSTSKQFIESKANMTGVDISGYKIVKHSEFAYVADTSRRGEKIALAFNDNEPCIISSIYTVFKIKDKANLLPEYLFLWFNRSEFDRYTRFHSWGSVRETFDWNDFCDIQIPIPPIEQQQKYVAIYRALKKNQQCYENSLADLQLICDSYIENLIKTEELKTLGGYIAQVNIKNYDQKITDVKGVSITKELIPTRAKMKGIKLVNYKIVKKNNFVFNPNTARMGNRIPIALNLDYDCIVSQIYPVFTIINKSSLLPKYLYLWLKRPEFDRYARYHSWGSARETFNWADMCEVKLPIPSIEKQQAIVKIYKVLEQRKQINEQLKAKIKDICPVLMRGVF